MHILAPEGKTYLIYMDMKIMVNKGVFSHSIALKVIQRNKEVQETQKVNGKILLSSGIPIFTNEKLECVIVYINDIQNLKNLEDQISHRSLWICLWYNPHSLKNTSKTC